MYTTKTEPFFFERVTAWAIPPSYQRISGYCVETRENFNWEVNYVLFWCSESNSQILDRSNAFVGPKVSVLKKQILFEYFK